jgi:hypothetical protein
MRHCGTLVAALTRGAAVVVLRHLPSGRPCSDLHKYLEVALLVLPLDLLECAVLDPGPQQGVHLRAIWFALEVKVEDLCEANREAEAALTRNSRPECLSDDPGGASSETARAEKGHLRSAADSRSEVNNLMIKAFQFSFGNRILRGRIQILFLIAGSLFSFAASAQTYPVTGVWIARDYHFPQFAAGDCFALKTFGVGCAF